MQHRRSCPRISYSTGPRAVCTILLSADTRLVCSSSHLRYCQYSITIARMRITSISNTQDIGVPSLLKLCLALLISLVTSGYSLRDLRHVGLTNSNLDYPSSCRPPHLVPRLRNDLRGGGLDLQAV